MLSSRSSFWLAINQRVQLVQWNASLFMDGLAALCGNAATLDHIENKGFANAGEGAKGANTARNVRRLLNTCFGIFLSHGAHCTLLADNVQQVCQLIKYILCKIIYKYA
jgi:hypothetical protein